jgi:hypothetical protein
MRSERTPEVFLPHSLPARQPEATPLPDFGFSILDFGLTAPAAREWTWKGPASEKACRDYPRFSIFQFSFSLFQFPFGTFDFGFSILDFGSTASHPPPASGRKANPRQRERVVATPDFRLTVPRRLRADVKRTHGRESVPWLPPIFDFLVSIFDFPISIFDFPLEAP